MRIADTSALYALFSSADKYHGAAARGFGLAEPVVLPGEIFSETIALIQRRQGFAAARAAGTFLLGRPNVALEATDGETLARAWSLFLDAAGKMSYADAVVLAWCQDRGADAFTFDRTLARRAKESRR